MRKTPEQRLFLQNPHEDTWGTTAPISCLMWGGLTHMFQVAICCNQSNQNGVHFILDTAPIVRNPRFVGSPVPRVPKIGLALGTMTMTYYENSDASDLEEIDDNDKTKTKTMITMIRMMMMRKRRRGRRRRRTTMTMTMMRTTMIAMGDAYVETRQTWLPGAWAMDKNAKASGMIHGTLAVLHPMFSMFFLFQSYDLWTRSHLFDIVHIPLISRCSNHLNWCRIPCCHLWSDQRPHLLPFTITAAGERSSLASLNDPQPCRI